MPSRETKLQHVSIRPGVSMLAVLRHLKYTTWFALAEFVDNALQSYISHDFGRDGQAQKSRRPLKVSIDIDSSSPGRITIRDNAFGIGKNVFPKAFRPASIPNDCTGLSEFGMGMKSAACWFSPQWHVRTKAIDELIERTVRFDITKIVKDEIEELEISETAARLEEHYTEVVLDNLHHIPMGRTLGKIKEHLTDIYRVFIRNGILELRVGTDELRYEDPPILKAPYFKQANGVEREWRKDIDFEFGNGLSVHGFAALRDPGNYSRSGFALFRRGRLIEGSGEEGYRPPAIFGTSGNSSYARLRLFGELHLDGFEVSHTKDGFRWDENEEPFVELLREHLDSGDLPLLSQCENYRSLAARKDRTASAAKALESTTYAIQSALPGVLPGVADQPPVETPCEPLRAQPTLARRGITIQFRNETWLIRIDLSDDPSEGDWLTVSDQTSSTSDSNTLEIRIAMAHPFMVTFAQTDAASIEPLLRVAAAIGLSERLARRSGVKSGGTVRRNMNAILREALSRP